MGGAATIAVDAARRAGSGCGVGPTLYDVTVIPSDSVALPDDPTYPVMPNRCAALLPLRARGGLPQPRSGRSDVERPVAAVEVTPAATAGPRLWDKPRRAEGRAGVPHVVMSSPSVSDCAPRSKFSDGFLTMRVASPFTIANVPVGHHQGTEKAGKRAWP